MSLSGSGMFNKWTK
uniref:Protein winged eye isoform x1 n=1 Tax=Triatoma infestans TaxID=30076 RepID=A0A161M2C2_TRIIF